MRTHGLAGTYRRGCRCMPCRIANTEKCLQERKRRADRLAANPRMLIAHGTKSTYMNWGCRCPWCVQANVDWCRGYQQRVRTRVNAGIGS